MVANKARAGDSSPRNPGPAEMVAKDRRRGIEGPLLQGSPKVSDPLLDLLQPSRSLRLQALTFSTALIPGTLPDLLQL